MHTQYLRGCCINKKKKQQQIYNIHINLLYFNDIPTYLAQHIFMSVVSFKRNEDISFV